MTYDSRCRELAIHFGARGSDADMLARHIQAFVEDWLDAAKDYLKSGDYHIGQRVAHHTLGEGEVTLVHDGKVFVKFDRVTTKGRHAEGIYDDAWLRVYGLPTLANAPDSPHG